MKLTLLLKPVCMEEEGVIDIQIHCLQLISKEESSFKI